MLQQRNRQLRPLLNLLYRPSDFLQRILYLIAKFLYLLIFWRIHIIIKSEMRKRMEIRYKKIHLFLNRFQKILTKLQVQAPRVFANYACEDV